MMKGKYIALLDSLVSGLVVYATGDEDLRKGLLLGFWVETYDDCLVDGRSSRDGLTFEDRHGVFIRFPSASE